MNSICQILIFRHPLQMMMKIWISSIIAFMKKKQYNLILLITIRLFNSFIHRDQESAHDRLVNDYFSETPNYNEATFRRRYCMSRPLFLRIVHEVKNHDNYFTQRRDSMGRLGLSCFQKITAVFRMLAYDLPADAVDEHIKIGEDLFRGIPTITNT